MSNNIYCPSINCNQKAILALDVPIVPNPGKAEKAVGTIAQKLSVAYTFKFLALFFD
jgi:hypothetical protein